MTVKTARKIGFFTSMGLLFGSIVGVGIFLKNNSVFNATNFDSTTTLLAWILGGVISLFAAISFSEIGSMKTKNVHGLPAWSEATTGKKTGYFVRFNFSFFYNIVLIVAIGMIVSEIFFQILIIGNVLDKSFGNNRIYVHVIIGLILTVGFVFLNYLSVYWSGIVSTIASIIKFLPLIIAALMGVILVSTNNNADGSNFHNQLNDPVKFSFTGLLAALPGVLFAYDSFLGIGPLTSKTKGGAKTISRVTLITMIAVVSLYTFITISQLLHNTGTIEQLFKSVLSSTASKAISIVVYTFIFISGIGVLNGISSAAVATLRQAISSDTFYASKRLEQKIGAGKTFWVYFGLSALINGAVMFIPSLVMNTDSPIDAYSNLPTVFFFSFYGVTIFFYAWRKRRTLNTDKINSALFYTAAVIAVVLIAFVMGYLYFYSYTIRAFISPNDISSFELWIGNGGISLIQAFGFFIGGAIIFACFPFVNYWLKVKYEKVSPVVDTQTLDFEKEVSEPQPELQPIKVKSKK